MLVPISAHSMKLNMGMADLILWHEDVHTELIDKIQSLWLSSQYTSSQ